MLKPNEVATARQGAIQTALAAGAGIGAAITVMLAFRRQRHQELATLITSTQADRAAALADRVAEHNKQDAAERRITELYMKAVEQLGSSKAAVRLGGLYALERLAQGDPDHRQTIVNVICAYLRMPYTLPGAAALGSRPPGPWRTEADSSDAEGERQVRLTAQWILAEHLRDERAVDQQDTMPADPRFWEGMRIDLTGANLIDVDFTRCRFAVAQFNSACFTGRTQFYRSIFTEYAGFHEAIFTGISRFDEAIFIKNVMFAQATFAGPALFQGTTFNGGAYFGATTFTTARFSGTTFTELADFSWTAFAHAVQFTEATFAEIFSFDDAIFDRGADFTKARVMSPGAFYSRPVGWTVVVGADDIGEFRRDGDALPSAPATP